MLLPHMEPPKDYRYKTSYDIAKRACDTILLHKTVLTRDELLVGRYAAIRLSDGGSDNTAYDSRHEAAKHQRHNVSRCAYIRIPLEHVTPQILDVMLWYARTVYDAGHREDPAHALIVSNQIENLK